MGAATAHPDDIEHRLSSTIGSFDHARPSGYENLVPALDAARDYTTKPWGFTSYEFSEHDLFAYPFWEMACCRWLCCACNRDADTKR